MGLPALWAGQEQSRTVRPASGRPAQAKSVILILLTGGASHLDTFDMKPEAPVENRGPFQQIATRTNGLQVCEFLPRLAERSDKLAVIRSMSHTDNSHLPATHKVLTGSPMPIRRDSDLDNVLSRRDFPCFAAGLQYVRPRTDGVPSGVTLPYPLIEGPLTWPGQHAGLLGIHYDPWQIHQDPNAANFRVESLQFPQGIDLERLQQRRSLLTTLDRQNGPMGGNTEGGEFGNLQESVFTLLTSGKVTRAFEIDREPAEVRERYGRHTFGQSLLLARRLVQAGVPIVQANMGIVQTWDTHDSNFTKLKDRLLPPLDQGVAALLDDLAASGLLQETLVVMLGEFGRTPKIGLSAGAQTPGRDHWAQVYSAVFAGAGVRGGQVIGKSDSMGAYPVTTAFTPEDVGATVYGALGVDTDVELMDAQRRPLRLNHGQFIEPLFTGASV